MLPSSRLCLLTIVGLIVPIRGQRSEKATPLSAVDPTTVNTHVLIEDPGAAHLEGQSILPTPTRPADVEGTETQNSLPETPPQVGHTAELETKTQQPTGTDAFFLVTDPGTQTSSKEATHSARLSEGTTALYHRRTPDIRRNDTHRQPGPEKDPFSYDVDTLRKRGLLVAAVLFITGIVILTSDKCRQMSRLCRKRGRAYSVVNTGSHEREDAARCSHP
ncbi:PREDICTED: FXYD domain-containing ion transport regulator 5 isoform X2 [Chinchilla lanigera]|nr:PREDICTED: FXYD domain-containing ion transport regulator 5 isoform X2 [Chinchilla lanigera]